MKSKAVVLAILLFALHGFCQMKIFVPSSIKNMNLNSSSSQWCYARTKESDNIVVFWESGFGSDSSTASGSYRVDMNTLLSNAEKAYGFYRDSLKFVLQGSSVTDSFKLEIFLQYSTDWIANGSGEDDRVQVLHVNPAAANVNNVIAHEIGHCFQYATGCDGDGGYRYGFGTNGDGGNGFWEQCAQWMSFKVYPEKQFTENDFKTYLSSHHKHILHETPRYANYFIQDYWTYKHDLTFLGTLWRDSKRPEDPVETYKRLNNLTQAQFNDEIFEQAARLTTWDLPRIISYGKKYIDSRAQVKMNTTSDNYWQIDKSVCLENYGYNCIKLVAPSYATDMTVQFKGDAGVTGYRILNTAKGGWRFGFVALLGDDTRSYSDIGSANVVNGANPDTSLTFSCPDNCSKLWLIVSGAPQEHWKHPWDDNDNNDEQWPYRVKFTNTNLFGQKVETAAPPPRIAMQRIAWHVNATAVHFSEQTAWQVSDLTGKQIASGYGAVIDISTCATGGYVVTCPGMHFTIVKR